MTFSHERQCATRFRAEAASAQWDLARIVDALEACCRVSRLRAHRLARGWTLAQALTELKGMCRSQNLDPGGVTDEQLRAWETGRRPRDRVITILCQLYETDRPGLGLARSTSVAVAARPGEPAPGRRGTRSEESLDELAESMRIAVDRTLADTTVSTTQLDQLEERLAALRVSYMVTPPTDMLVLLLSDLGEVRMLAASRQPAATQVRLSEMTAVLSTLIADALMKLGRIQQSQRWYGTARAAADDSGNAELRARVRAQAAMLPYYYGPLDLASRLAREARYLSSRRPTETAAFAAAAEARALARQRDHEGALTAIRHAQDVFDRCQHGAAVEDAWAFPRRRLLLYFSGTYTYLGMTTMARRVQQEALGLYPDQSGIDPALLRLEAAMCLAHERSLSEACDLAVDAYLRVPAAHRTKILGARAGDVLAILPVSQRTARPARQLGEILALPPGTM
ncbi:helix-turn-helix domain-containing protein [Kitasatospora cystarginea]|uniref:helix-turn-helix domain-containing protein n=1 Tax=Kitasatospora cystarginea TaxID=58350 RepID=UPI0031D140B4